ncbi:protein HIRA homolog [Phlebotomus argentipes]|uniref:protein HIRA homolog n=1 Tax=Phlebotomus argentipes TaxID=94469 RepID=UPI0028932941|nr:protein HIRA homolog [Phlebotomus argentipes]
MKLLKPDWVHHDDKPIFSLDIHPDGTKFATGGQGNDSGRVVVWNLAPVIDEKAEMDKSVPKILCQMDNHLACVNSVRWSLSGQCLASGGDDKTVMVWKKAKGTGGVFGSGGFTKSAENWRCVTTLRGHAGDILDMAWSPQDRWLSSCSVDNTIIIWDVFAVPSIVAILKGHTGLVKGVAWDPVGKFIASQSDDRSIKIWKTADWTCQTTITEPFQECGGTTHILRLSWSPDGQYLVSAHAMNGGGPTAQIIEREGWKCDKDFVGHRKAVTCVRFHNSIMMRTAPKTNKTQQYCCLAVGSRDHALSVWMTALQRPLLVIHDLFQDSILDLSWSADGYVLMACSGDGTVACLQFSDSELGTPLSEEDKNSLYQRMYGKSASDMNAQSEKDMIVENAELLDAIVREKPKQPAFIATLEGAQNLSSVPNQQNNVSNSQPEKQEQNVNFSGVSTQSKQAIHKQIETRTADGKRRITPMFIPMSQEANDTPVELNSSSRSTSSIVIEKVADKPEALSEGQKVEQLDSRLTKSIVPPAKTASLDMPRGEPLPVQITAKPEVTNIPRTLTAGRPEVISGNFVRTVSDLRIQVANAGVKSPFGMLSRVFCCPIATPTKTAWEIFLGSSVVNCSACTKCVIVCCSDGTVRFINARTGILTLPIINMPTAIVQSAFNFSGELGGVVSECGLVRVWNIEEQKVIVSTSCTDLLRGGSVKMLNVTEKGTPFVLMSNGCAFTFSKDLESWLVLNSKDTLNQRNLIKYKPPANAVQKNFRTYPIMAVQGAAHSLLPASNNFVNVTAATWENVSQLTFIENQIQLCESIQSPAELKYWYSALGFHLANYGTEQRLRLTLDDLLGSAHSTNADILGISKLTLLDLILESLKLQTKWQRIYMEYTEQLSDLRRNPQPM